MDWIKLFGINLRYQLSRLIELLKLLPYYLHQDFLKFDLYYLKAYLGQNPYQMCKRYLKQSHCHEDFGYGETWLTQFLPRMYQLGIKPTDTFFEVGSGTGRLCFWVHLLSRCQVVGIETVPAFVKKATDIKNKLGLHQMEFREEDCLETDYSKANWIYFYGTSFHDEFIEKLLLKWRDLPRGTQIISTSFALNEYLDYPEYFVWETFKMKYPWGTTHLYIQQKI